jgi:hypothetical protein
MPTKVRATETATAKAMETATAKAREMATATVMTATVHRRSRTSPSCAPSTSGDIGCGGPTVYCGGAIEIGWSRMDGEQVLIGRAGLCELGVGSGCEVSSEGLVLNGAPECACLCDPAFPGS